ncbi:MAG: indole-3-glycerol phosphate synthase TrpC [Thermoleophilia bacterium]|nr:indole-3-glycerol phosphate synthase TrpC [Thermoleophilia bacterium]
MGFLEDIVERTVADLERRRRAVPAADLEARLGPARRGRPFSEALVGEGISLIAEMKRASPSKGPIRPGASVADVVRAYEAAGASACSVLTEGPHFGGSIDDLAEARAACSLPLLRKDFIVDPYQLLEARVAGADAVLLIVAALGGERMSELMAAASELDMDCLVEVHDEDEVEVAVEAGSEVIGINNRNLHSFEVDTRTVFRLLPDVPAGTVVVAESGIATRGDVLELESAGVDAILVGEALMRSGDPAEAARALLGAAAER